MYKVINRLILFTILLTFVYCTFTSCEEEKKDVGFSVNRSANGKSGGLDLTPQERSFKLAFRNIASYRADEIINEIELETRTNLKFKIDKLAYNYDHTIDLPLDAAEASHMMQNNEVDAMDSAGAFQYLAQNGLIMDLTSLFPQYAPNYFAKFSEEELARVTVNGRIMGIPAHNTGFSRYCVGIRKELVDKYKITDIKTIEDYESVLKLIKQKEPDYDPQYYNLDRFELMMYAKGYIELPYKTYMYYKIDDPEMKVVPLENTDCFVEVTDRLRRWIYEGYEVVASTVKPPATFISKLGEFSSASEYDNGSDWIIYPLYPDRPSVIDRSGDYILVISSKSKNAKNVLTFLEWVESSQENYDLFMYGIKGKDYEIEGDRIKYIKYPFYIGEDPFVNIDLMRETVYDHPGFKDVIKKVGELDEIMAPHSGFLPDESAYKNMLEKRRLLYVEFRDIYTGEGQKIIENPPDIKGFRKKFQDAGSDDLRRLLQKELDEWRKDKGN